MDTLPPFFPSYTKECKSVALPFFDCFTKWSAKLHDEDTQSGRRGVMDCVKELKPYWECMAEAEKKKPPKRFRVRFVPIVN